MNHVKNQLEFSIGCLFINNKNENKVLARRFFFFKSIQIYEYNVILSTAKNKLKTYKFQQKCVANTEFHMILNACCFATAIGLVDIEWNAFRSQTIEFCRHIHAHTHTKKISQIRRYDWWTEFPFNKITLFFTNILPDKTHFSFLFGWWKKKWWRCYSLVNFCRKLLW